MTNPDPPHSDPREAAEHGGAGFDSAGTIDYEQAIKDINRPSELIRAYTRRTRHLVVSLGLMMLLVIVVAVFAVVGLARADDAQARAKASLAQVASLQKQEAAMAKAALVANCESKNAFRASVTAEWTKYTQYPPLSGLSLAAVIQRDARNKAFLQFVTLHDEPNDCNNLTSPTLAPAP